MNTSKTELLNVLMQLMNNFNPADPKQLQLLIYIMHLNETTLELQDDEINAGVLKLVAQCLPENQFNHDCCCGESDLREIAPDPIYPWGGERHFLPEFILPSTLRLYNIQGD